MDIVFLGYYLYFEASSPAKQGDTACFHSSKDFAAGSCYRLTFWYHMLGSAMGKLSVQIKNNGGGSTRTVFEKSGQQGDKWLQANVTVTSSSSYKVL